MKNILVFLLVFISGNALAENTLIAIVNNNPITLNSIENQLENVNSAQEKIKIGLLVPLTGKDAEIGQSIIKATRLAINKINDDPRLMVKEKQNSSKKPSRLI